MFFISPKATFYPNPLKQNPTIEHNFNLPVVIVLTDITGSVVFTEQFYHRLKTFQSISHRVFILWS
ncbi:MAG: hypothetical protein H0X62_07550 [Bacteroidetes bacterium]|nr:hypothetical protein [Bacteroidota bacterium]